MEPDEEDEIVNCPVCQKRMKNSLVSNHLDTTCAGRVGTLASSSAPGPSSRTSHTPRPNGTQLSVPSSTQKRSAATFFSPPAAKRQATVSKVSTPAVNRNSTATKANGVKRSFDEALGPNPPLPAMGRIDEDMTDEAPQEQQEQISPDSKRMVKRPKTRGHVPLAERMRPRTLDEVAGQELVGPRGILRHLIETDQVPSMILWGGSGTGKTTIARLIANRVKARFIELNATSTGVAEVKKYFAEAASELQLRGRKTIIFCDEIHRFSKSQQDVFLKPVEAGTITLIGATTENPSFKVQNALLSRCRTFVLTKLDTEHVYAILQRALASEIESNPTTTISPLLDDELLLYLSRFSDGDARTALNLLELTLGLTSKPSTPDNPLTKEIIKRALTKSLVYDRAGDQHYDTISAFHKSIRGSDPDATIYYLARMLQSGEDPLFIARRMVVIASEDVGLADNTLQPLATSTFTAVQQIGMPEARIPLGHCAMALALAPKSVRAYRALNSAYSCLMEPGKAGLPIPVHLRNAPTRMMKDLGFGESYKYPPNYRDGQVKQVYLPEGLVGRRFLVERDLGTEVDPELEDGEDGGEDGVEMKAKGETGRGTEEPGNGTREEARAETFERDDTVVAEEEATVKLEGSP